MPEVTDEQIGRIIRRLVEKSKFSDHRMLKEIRRVTRGDLAYWVQIEGGGYVQVLNASSKQEAQKIVRKSGQLVTNVVSETDWSYEEEAHEIIELT